MHTLRPFAALTFLGLTFCQIDDGVVPETDTVTTEHAIYYELSFDETGVERTEQGSLTTTSSGFSVWLRSGWVSTTSAQLVPCRTARVWFGARTALAGHSEGDGDPSAVEVDVAESLTNAASRELGAAWSDRQYCAVSFGIGPSDDMEGATIVLDLAVETSAGMVERVITSNASYTRQVELSATVESGRYATKLVLERRLGTLFDDIDFDTATDDEIAVTVMNNLLADTEISIYPDS